MNTIHFRPVPKTATVTVVTTVTLKTKVEVPVDPKKWDMDTAIGLGRYVNQLGAQAIRHVKDLGNLPGRVASAALLNRGVFYSYRYPAKRR